MKRILRLIGLVAAIVVVVWLTREHLLPTPRVPKDSPPHYRSTPPPPPHDPDDLTAIKGIGPVYAARLEDIGIRSFRGLAETDADTIADSIGTTADAVHDWIVQAKAKLH